MKRIAIKRVIYSEDYGSLWREILPSSIIIGGEEYDGKMSDFNILGAMIEVGKWKWASSYGNCIVRVDGVQMYAKVHTFYQYQKSWYNLFSDSIKRILRI